MRLPLEDFGGRLLRFADLTSSATFDRERSHLDARGLYLDMQPWGYHVFDVTANDEASSHDQVADEPAGHRVLVARGR